MKPYERLVNSQLNFSNTFSNAKMTYITILDLEEFSKLGIHDFCIWNHLGFQKCRFNLLFIKIQSLNCSNFLKWKIDHYNKCISWWVKQTCYSRLFNLNPFRVSKMQLEFVIFKNSKFELFKLCQMKSWIIQQMYMLMSLTNLLFITFSFKIKNYFKLWLQLEFFLNSNFESSKQSPMTKWS
jgi:hypothetical protein